MNIDVLMNPCSKTGSWEVHSLAYGDMNYELLTFILVFYILYFFPNRLLTCLYPYEKVLQVPETK